MERRLIDPRGAKVFANGLQRTAGDLRDAVEVRIAGGGREPQIQQWLYAGHRSRARGQIGHERNRSLMQVLAKAFVVGKEESLVLLERSAQGPSELVALKWRSRSLIEIIRSIQRIVAQEFIDRAVPLVASRLGDDD